MRDGSSRTTRVLPTRRAAALVLVLSPVVAANSAGNNFTPRLTIETTVSDNIFLDSSGEETDFVVQLNPGFAWERRSGRLNLVADLNMQNVFYAENSDQNDTYLQGQFLAEAELVPSNFFWDFNASARQQVISRRGRIGDNLNATNTSNVYDFGTSPYWVNDFNGYTESTARYAFNAVRVQEGASDSDIHEVSLRLDSGRRFTRLNWSGRGFWGRQVRDEDENTTRRSLDGDVGYVLNPQWELVARGGYRKDDFATRNNNENGWFWSAGAVWTPNQYFSLGGTYGPDDKEIRATFDPTPRTSLVVAWQDRGVGANTGTVWFAAGSVNSRYSRWQLSYTERVTSSQLEEARTSDRSDTPPPPVVNDSGQPISNPNVLGLTDDEFLSRRFGLSFGFEKSKTNINLNATFERREFDDSDESDDRSWGGDARWTWRFAPRTRSEVEGRLRTIKVDGESGTDVIAGVRLAIVRQLSEKISGSVEYSYLDRDGDGSDVDYTENRVTANVAIRF